MVLVLPFLLLERIRVRGRGLPLPVIVCLLVVLRMSYHWYYGVGAVALLPWAIVMVLAYWRYRQVLPLILAHASYDVLGTFVDHGFMSGRQQIVVACVIAGVLGLGYLVLHSRDRHAPLPRTSA